MDLFNSSIKFLEDRKTDITVLYNLQYEIDRLLSVKYIYKNIEKHAIIDKKILELRSQIYSIIFNSTVYVHTYKNIYNEDKSCFVYGIDVSNIFNILAQYIIKYENENDCAKQVDDMNIILRKVYQLKNLDIKIYIPISLSDKYCDFKIINNEIGNNIVINSTTNILESIENIMTNLIQLKHEWVSILKKEEEHKRDEDTFRELFRKYKESKKIKELSSLLSM